MSRGKTTMNPMAIAVICAPTEEVEHAEDHNHEAQHCYDSRSHHQVSPGQPHLTNSPKCQSELASIEYHATNRPHFLLPEQDAVPPSPPPRLPKTGSVNESKWTMLSSSSSSSIQQQPSCNKQSHRKSNSERGKLYRFRRKNYIDSLHDSVQSLQNEVRQLIEYRNLQQQVRFAAAADAVDGHAHARIISEYFNLFRTGIPVSMASDANAMTHRLSKHAMFINAMVDPNLDFCGVRDGYGPAYLLGNWEDFTMYHGSLNLELINIRVIVADPEPIVSASVAVCVQISRTTIEKWFPHILYDEVLVRKLIGASVKYTNENTFYFGENGKIHRYDSELDCISAFAKVLGNLEDVAKLCCHVK